MYGVRETYHSIGIKRVVYGEKYRIMDGVELLERAGVQVDFMPDTPAANL